MVSDPAIEATGLWSYALPRFKLKTRVSVLVEVGDAGGDVLLSTDGEMPVMLGAGGTAYGVTVNMPSAGATRFVDWLLSDIGQRTLAAYRLNDQQVFFPVETVVVVEEIRLEGNVVVGEAEAYAKCGRCHVVGPRNRMNGIDSTPSFAALRTLDDWQEKFNRFWTLNPHPSFTQIENVTPPFPPDLPPFIYPIFLTSDEVTAIGAYMQTIQPIDLGPPLEGE